MTAIAGAAPTDRLQVSCKGNCSKNVVPLFDSSASEAVAWYDLDCRISVSRCGRVCAIAEESDQDSA